MPACADVALARPPEHDSPAATNDVAEAQRRFAAQQPARATTDAVRTYGQNEASRAYGGLWLDGPLLIAAFTGDLGRHRRTLRDRVAHPDRLRVTRVAHPLADLEARRERLRALRDDPRLGNSLLSHRAIDVRRNLVEVGVVADSASARHLLADELGADWVCVRPQGGPGRNAEPGGGTADVVAVPTTDIANGEDALATGVLGGDADGGCVWLEHGDERDPVVWPPGFGTRFTDRGVELIDDTGTAVAREGERLKLGGGSDDVDPDDRCMLGQERAFVAGDVRVSND